MTRYMKRTSLLGVALLLLSLSPLLAQGRGAGQGRGQNQGNGFGRGGSGRSDGMLPALVRTLPLEDVDQADAEGLILMREEEKLARDAYLALAETWQLPLFKNIARSEMRHMTAVKSLLDRYELPDPAAPDSPGLFQSTLLQTLYKDLTAHGAVSLTEALKVGVLIEELDIADLKELLEQTDNADIRTVYQNLLEGSRNHLRAFSGQLESLNIHASFPYLSAEDREAILNTPMERGFYDKDGNPVYGRTGW